MTKTFKKFLTCAVILMAVFSLSQIKAMADSNVTSANINLSKSDDYEAFGFDMPKDGTIKINASVKDTDTVPGTLTIAIQSSNEEGSPKVKEITGITAGTPVTDLKVELSAGKYYISYKLNNAAGDLSNTSISLSCTAELLTVATPVTNISELKVDSFNSFDEIVDDKYNELKFGNGEENKNIVIPFKVKNKGAVYLSMMPDKDDFETITGAIYKDKDCTKAVGKSFTLESADEAKSYMINMSAGGTYYIKFTLDNADYEAVGETKFLVKLYEINGADRTITLDKPTIAYQDKEGRKINYKITVKKKCVLIIDVTSLENSEKVSASFQLLDKNKKALSKISKVKGRTDEDVTDAMFMEKLYTVTAGTYYIQATASSSIYQFEGSTMDINSNAGSSKAKAKLIKVDKDLGKGYVTYADKTSKTGWYKFEVPSYQYVELYMASYLDGKCDYEILDSKGKIVYKYSKDSKIPEGFYYTWLGSYYNKGTYYVKIFKTDSSSSFAYAFKLSNTPHKK